MLWAGVLVVGFWAIFYAIPFIVWLLSPVARFLRRVHIPTEPERRKVTGIREADDWNRRHPGNPLMVDREGNVSALHSPPHPEPGD